MKKFLPVATREIALPVFVIVILGGIVLYITIPLVPWRLQWIIDVFVTFCFLFLVVIIYFYRDPERKINTTKGAILSPADGKIISIEGDVSTKYLKGKCKKISIFLSLFNVHVQRMPISGVIEDIEHIRGKFLPAFKSAASQKNDQKVYVIKGDNISIVVKQIAGVLVQKAISWVNKGDELKAGNRIGMIRFSSRVELFVPVSVKLDVVLGMKVIAGETVIGYQKIVESGRHKSK